MPVESKENHIPQQPYYPTIPEQSQEAQSGYAQQTSQPDFDQLQPGYVQPQSEQEQVQTQVQFEQPVYEEPQPVIQQPTYEEPQPVIQQPIYEEPQSVIQQPIYEEPQSNYMQPPQVQPPQMQAPQVAPSAHPEVVIPKTIFEEYGFEEETISNHNYGGFMQDTNPSIEEIKFPDENVFNDQTPNFDIAEVEEKARQEDETDAFTHKTLNVYNGNVSAKNNSEPLFHESSSLVEPVPPPSFDRSEGVVETISEPEAPEVDFMASMKAMFVSMGDADETEETAASASVEQLESESASVEQSELESVAVEQPKSVTVDQSVPVDFVETTASLETEETETSAESDVSKLVMEQLMQQFEVVEKPVAVAPDMVITEEPAAVVPDMVITEKPAAVVPDMVITEKPAAVVPDMVVTETPANIIQDISSNSVFEEEKGPEYWEYMNSILNNFDKERDSLEQEYVPVTEEPIEEPGIPITPSSVVMDAPIEDMTWLVSESDDVSISEKQAEKEAKKAERIEAKAQAKVEKAEKARLAKEAKEAKKAEKVKRAPVNEMPTAERKGTKKGLAAIFPVKGDSALEIIRKIVLIVSVLVLIGCGIYFLISFIGTNQQKKISTELSNIMTSGENSQIEWSAVHAQYPDIQFPSGMQTKFVDLYALNQDLVGWIRISDLGIDYPVVQAADNSFYLKRDFKKNSSAYGTMFLGATNNAQVLDKNNVIYGHSMRRDTQMFTALREYKDIEGFKKNPIIEYNTLYENYKFKVYAVFISNGTAAGDLGGYVFDYTSPNFASIETFAGFIDQINQRKLYTTGVTIMPEDKLITLSTCTYEFDNARLVVVGRLIRDGESEEVDMSKVVINENPRYPQAWYSANGKTNPYKDVPQWKA